MNLLLCRPKISIFEYSCTFTSKNSCSLASISFDDSCNWKITHLRTFRPIILAQVDNMLCFRNLSSNNESYLNSAQNNPIEERLLFITPIMKARYKNTKKYLFCTFLLFFHKSVFFLRACASTNNTFKFYRCTRFWT